ncbi:MAG: MBL fold metallo-hydrolase RNA specificity domain-containing protein [Desulfobacca sp.]|uniref:MBL fold metallo-hydrolase RNA specificity domain-containing protein n=1 Tax=Desulfobacca sp. TaxID=2067990 RepID=UPI00404A6C5D
MHISFYGAAQTVTGSQHLLTINGRRLLLDCGFYQGKRQETWQRNRHFPFRPADLDVVVLSHAHIDHAGNIPNLVRQGFRGKIICTPPTVDLCGAMLPDSGHIQEEDVAYVNRQRRRQGEPPFKPIYTQADATAALDSFVGLEYEQPLELFPGVSVTLYDAGHLLGAAIVAVDFSENGGPRQRLVFTGDLGRVQPILRDPTQLAGADILLMESTYGNRLHPPLEDSEKILGEVIHHTYRRGGKVIIPAFAVERTQLLIYLLNRLQNRGDLPDLPVYVDSPLAVNVTEIFRRHTKYFDAEAQRIMTQDPDGDIFNFRRLHYIRDVEESKRLHFRSEPCIIISASGMAEAGRIQHHLKNNIENPNNTILIVGWQAPHTLGRRLVELAPAVKIFGITYSREAEVVTLNGFSGHADQRGLLQWAQGLQPPPRYTFLVHGDQAAGQALAKRLRQDLGFGQVLQPALNQTVAIP